MVDFAGVKCAGDVSPAVINELHEAFTTLGFVIIKAHGIEEKVCFKRVKILEKL